MFSVTPCTQLAALTGQKYHIAVCSNPLGQVEGVDGVWALKGSKHASTFLVYVDAVITLLDSGETLIFQYVISRFATVRSAAQTRS